MYSTTNTPDKYTFRNAIYEYGLRLEKKSIDQIPAVPNSPQNLNELATTIAEIVAIPFKCLFVTFGYSSGQLLKFIGKAPKLPTYGPVYDAIAALKIKIAAIKTAGLPGWEKEVMVLLRKSRFDSPEQDLQRLRSLGILTKEIEKSLEQAIRQVRDVHGSKLNHIKAVMARSLEVQWVYADKYYVFIHAQGSNWIALNYFIKELHKAAEPEKDFKHHKFLRAPFKLEPLEINSARWKTLRSFFLGQEHIKNIQEYINSKWIVSDLDGETREHLLSVDACMGAKFNSQYCDSALHFLINNQNILGKTDKIKSFYKQIIDHYRPDIPRWKQNQLANKIFSAGKTSQEVPCGNLFAICVPKDQSDKIQYRAHAYGKVCKCHPVSKNDEILTKVQKGIIDGSTKCDSIYIGCPIPRFRLYTPLLTPEIPIYFITPSEKSERDMIKSNIRKIVAEIIPAKIPVGARE